jgi:ABC-type glycerol-3-phosphate transport system substrate-binding protein
MQGTKHPDLAWKYVKYATSRAVQIKRVASGLAISGNRRAAAHYAGNPVEDAFIRALDVARPPWGARVENYDVCRDFGKEAVDNILFSGVPVAKALKDAAALMDAALYTGGEKPDRGEQGRAAAPVLTTTKP